MLFQRILTVVIGAPIVVGAIFCPFPAVFKVFVALCAFFAFLEFFTIVGFQKGDKSFAVFLGMVHLTTLLFVLVPFWKGESFYWN